MILRKNIDSTEEFPRALEDFRACDTVALEMAFWLLRAERSRRQSAFTV